MGSSRKAPSPIRELAPWVLLLIVGLNASRMASNDRLPREIVLVAFAAVALACGGALVLGRLLGQFTCPGCRRPTLRRLVRSPRLFSCSFCGQRVRLDARDGWQDARGPQFDAEYRPKTGIWLEAPAPAPAPAPDGTTCGTLLARKRFRDRFLLAFVRDRRKPWPGPRFAPLKGGSGPVAGESTCGALLRSKKNRDRGLRGEKNASLAEAAPAPPLYDRWLDR